MKWNNKNQFKTKFTKNTNSYSKNHLISNKNRSKILEKRKKPHRTKNITNEISSNINIDSKNNKNNYTYVIFKNSILSVWKNKLEIIIIAILSTIIIFMVLSFSSFILFLTIQNKAIKDSCFSSDNEINMNWQSKWVNESTDYTPLGLFKFNNSNISASNFTVLNESSYLNFINTYRSIIDAYNTKHKTSIKLMFNTTIDKNFFNSNGNEFEVLPIHASFWHNNWQKYSEKYKNYNVNINKNAFPDNFANYDKYLENEWNTKKKYVNLALNSDKYKPYIKNDTNVRGSGKFIHHIHKWENEQGPINTIDLIKGRLPENNDEIDISYSYAYFHNIKINSLMSISKQQYKVVGFGSSYKYMFPELHPFNLIPDNKKECLVWTLYDFYSSSFSNTFLNYNYSDNVFTLQFKFINATKGQKKIIIANFKTIYNSLMNGILSSEKKFVDFVVPSDKSYIFYHRTHFIIEIKNIIKFLIIILEAIVFAISFFSLFIIILKQNQQDSKQIGVLKALGYKNSEISVMYIIVPIISSIIGIMGGFVLSIIFIQVFILIFLRYLNFSINGIFSPTIISTLLSKDYLYIIFSILVTLIFVVSCSFAVSLKLVKKNNIELLTK